jgi:hypothetical protein
MDLVNEIGSIISKSAPLLGGVISSIVPGSDLILKMVCAAFNVKNDQELLEKLKNDPESAIRLREVQANNEIQLQQLSVTLAMKKLEYKRDVYAYSVDDRKDARQHENWITHTLAILFTLAFFYFQNLAISTPSTQDDMIAGSFRDIEIFIISYYFGDAIQRRTIKK